MNMSEKHIVEKRVKIDNKEDMTNINKIAYFQNHIKVLNEVLIERKNIIENTIKTLQNKYEVPLDSDLSFDSKTQELVIQFEEK